MRYISILAACLLLSGCMNIPGLKMPDSWKSLASGTDSTKSVVLAEKASQSVSQMSDADKKVDDARKKMELEYSKFKEELQKAYDDLKKKDDDNFAKIGELNYGIYYVTQEKKKQDMNTLVAHLRAKEIMNRVDKIPEDKKDTIEKQVDDEKQLTIDGIYQKYKANIDLAIQQKAALDQAEQTIAQKEKEKQALRDANKANIERLEAEKKTEVERIQKETADKVKLAQEAQRAEMLGYIVKSLVGIGILFLILAGLLRNISMGIVCVSAFALAYCAAMVPMWVIGSVVGLMLLLMVWSAHSKAIMSSVQQKAQVAAQLVQAPQPPPAQPPSA